MVYQVTTKAVPLKGNPNVATANKSVKMPVVGYNAGDSSDKVNSMTVEQETDYWERPNGQAEREAFAGLLENVDKYVFAHVRSFKDSVLGFYEKSNAVYNRECERLGVQPNLTNPVYAAPMFAKAAMSLIPDTLGEVAFMGVAGAATKPVLLAGAAASKTLLFTGKKAFNYGAKTLGYTGTTSGSKLAYSAVGEGVVGARGAGVSNAFKIEKLVQNTEQSILHQFNRNVDLSIRSPSAVAIQRGWGELSPRQVNLLEQLSKPGKTITISKNDINVYDIACLTAKTGDEFAMFTLGSQRVILRGNCETVKIPHQLFEKFKAEKWKWSAHTHPANTNAPNLTPSGLEGDIGILLELDQEQSMIINSLGKRRVFDLNSIDHADYMDPAPKPRGKR